MYIPYKFNDERYDIGLLENDSRYENYFIVYRDGSV